MRPNVLTIICDQLRYDVFSHRGNRHISTPHLDRLAAQGALFTDATCTFPLCGPARAALLTGCFSYDGHYRVQNREPDQPSVFAAHARTVDQLLDEAGYHVEYHGKWHTGNSHRECYRGDTRVWGHRLQEWHDHVAARYERPSGPDYAVDSYSGWPYRKIPYDDLTSRENAQRWTIYGGDHFGISEVRDEDTLTAFTVDKTVRFIRERRGNRPWAATCSILHPHLPFTPNPTYAAMFDPSKMPMPANVDAFYKAEFNLFHGKKDRRKAIPDLIPLDGSPHGLGQFLALYYALVKEIDDHLGRLLACLEEEGLLSNTLLIFTSDHGDMGGSHNCFAKYNFFEESLRVPLILHWPNGISPGTRHPGPATGADIAPTILDACGITSPFPCHGHSLLADIAAHAPARTWAYAELTRDGESYHCLRSHDGKVIFDGNRHPIVVFDLAQDPGEFHNRVHEFPEIVADAISTLAAYRPKP